MDKKTIKLIEQYANKEFFGDRQLADIPLWELRDNISNNVTVELSDQEQELVDLIVLNTISNVDFHWHAADLSVLGEAKVQAQLRSQGYDLKCWNLNQFPNTSSELNHHIDRLSAVGYAKSWVSNLKCKTLNFYYNIKIWVPKNIYLFFGIFSLVSLITSIYLRPDLLIPALIVAYFFCNFSAIVIHEWWTHDLVKPKNIVIETLLDYLGHILFVTSRLAWRFDHRWHHIHYKTEKDLDYMFKDTPAWFYLFFSTPLELVLGKKLKNDATPPEFWPSKIKCYHDNLAKLNPISRYIELNWVKISIISHVILIALLGFVYWSYFVLFQAWLFRCYIIGFNEIVTHWPLQTSRKEESNTPYLFPVCCGTAYHVTHHTEPTTIVLGPGKLKYLNVQYWFIKLLFRPAPGTKYS